MANQVFNSSLSTFPSNTTEALALLYTQAQPLDGKAPEEIAEIYHTAYYAILKDYISRKDSGWFTQQRDIVRGQS